MQQQAIKEILELLPKVPGAFTGSEYPLPVKTTFLGDRDINLSTVKDELKKKMNDDVKGLLEPLLLAAEAVESVRDDRDTFFITDTSVQSKVFNGSKWKAGWALVLGNKYHKQVIEKFQGRNFMVFTDRPEIKDTIYIGDRPTSPVYFLQMMVRFGLVWGNIAAGDDHEMGHYLEKDMPGVLIITEDQAPLKYLIILGLMKLGAPAVVPLSFPFPYGNRKVADNPDDILERACEFTNLRQRYYKNEVISLPDYCNHAYAKEKISPVRTIGKTENSFFCLKPMKEIGLKRQVSGKPGKEIGILVEIPHRDLTDDIAYFIEEDARGAINFLPGIHADEKDGAFYIELAENTDLVDDMLFSTIEHGIRLLYPRIETLCIHIIYDPELLRKECATVKDYKKRRKAFVNNMTEDNTEEYCVCTECRPFSLVHTCIITPERQPMCGSRTYASVKAASYFGSKAVPYQRRTEKDIPLRSVFKKGKLLDKKNLEYEGCNRVYNEMTEGQLQHVYLHSLRKYPHTSCGCFQTLAFWIDEVQGIGIMKRNSKALTPAGESWSQLANRAGGKQSPGIMGCSQSYIRSSRFLESDGGHGAVVWMDSELAEKLSGTFKPGQKIATEKETATIEELKQFLAG
jgi:acetyl-CoA decarbonylase/synthase complex subunit beta